MDLLGLEREDLLWYQMMIRTLIVFFYAMFLLRITGMRAFGSKSAFDVVVSITLGALLSRAITGHYPFFSTMLSAFALAVLHRLIAIVSSRSQPVSRITEGSAVEILKSGKLDRNSMKRFCISQTDIETALRENGIADIEEASSLWYEPNGKLTVVKK